MLFISLLKIQQKIKMVSVNVHWSKNKKILGTVSKMDPIYYFLIDVLKTLWCPLNLFPVSMNAPL